MSKRSSATTAIGGRWHERELNRPGETSLMNWPAILHGIEAATASRRGPWRSFEAVELATLEWMDWFNNRRLLEPIGHIPLAEAEARYYAQSEEFAMAA